MSYDVFDVVVVPFPFADRDVVRKRPALVLTQFAGFGDASGIVCVAMITAARSSDWPGDVPVSDLQSAGLGHECLVRMKLASLSYSRIEKRLGSLCAIDRAAVGAALRAVFAESLAIDAHPHPR